MTAARTPSRAGQLRLGIDLGGTKIEGALFAPGDEVLARDRVATPRNDYDATLGAIAEIVSSLETLFATSGVPSIGVAIPGSISSSSGFVQNANSTWLNGKPFDRDLARLLGRPVKVANDANCFVLSEAADGAGAGAHSVFGVILGTGCGGGLILDGRLVNGRQGIGGEWGHNPLPWAEPEEHPGPACWCGRLGCMETWVSGPALSADHQAAGGARMAVEDIVTAAAAGDAAAEATLKRHVSRLARGLAHVVNIFDPEVIVLGGGLSKLEHLYEELPAAMAPHIFADRAEIVILPPKWGDASGVRGAAWLWDLTSVAK